MKKPKASPHEMHLGIAEQGKLFAVKGNHNEALRHYREAIRMAVSIKAPEVFFRHYTQCVLESLEHSGGFDEILRFCMDADTHYQGLDLQDPLRRRDHGTILERAGVIHMKAGRTDEAKTMLADAVERAGAGSLPLAEELLGWLSRGYAVSATRLKDAQRRHEYFVVDKKLINTAIARKLPREVGQQPAL